MTRPGVPKGAARFSRSPHARPRPRPAADTAAGETARSRRRWETALMGITTLARPMSLRSQLVAALAVVGATILVLGAVAYGMAQAVIQDAAAVEDADAVLASLAGVGTAMEAMQTADARILATRSTGAFAAFARSGSSVSTLASSSSPTSRTERASRACV